MNKRLLMGSTIIAASMVMGAAAWAQDAGAPAAKPAVASPAPALPEANRNILEEVVVTGARKREENVQATPVAVTAISQEMLERVHATDLRDIAALVPNLQIHEVTGGGTNEVGIYLRGFGTSQSDPSADPAIPIFIDGVYQSQVLGSELDLFSQNIEVLRGPQGTLYGKNAPTGAVNITSIRPTGDFSGKVSASYGSYDKTELKALVNIPILDDVLAINVAGSKKYMGNWYYNVLNGKDDAGGSNADNIRLGILFTPTSRLTSYTTLTYSHVNEAEEPLQSFATTQVSQPYQQVTAACLLAGFCTAYAPFTYASVQTDHTKQTSYDIMENLEYKFDAVTLTSVTGYKMFQQVANQDFSRVPAPFGLDRNQTTNLNQESEELRISSNQGGGLTLNDRLDWVAGAYYGRDRYGQVQPVFVYGGATPAALGGLANAQAACGNVPIPLCGINAPNSQNQLDNSMALYAHAIYDITDNWNLSFGVRQSYDHKDHNTAAATLIGAQTANIPLGTPFYQSAGFHNRGFEAGTQYKIDPDKMVYFRFAQGYRAGGIQGTAGSQSPSYPPFYAPETVNTYEVGAKTDWFDHRLRLNLAVFDSDYNNLQRDLSFFTPAVVQAIINAGSATSQGVEFEGVVVPTEDLTLRSNFGYITTTYHTFVGNLESGVLIGPYDEALNLGQKFPNTPKFTVDLGFDYVHDWGNAGSTTFSADWNWQSSQNLNDETIPTAYQPSYGLVNASLRWDDPTDRYAISFYGQNIFNQLYRTYAVPALGDIETYGLPATWGMELQAKF